MTRKKKRASQGRQSVMSRHYTAPETRLSIPVTTKTQIPPPPYIPRRLDFLSFFRRRRRGWKRILQKILINFNFLYNEILFSSPLPQRCHGIHAEGVNVLPHKDSSFFGRHFSLPSLNAVQAGE